MAALWGLLLLAPSGIVPENLTATSLLASASLLLALALLLPPRALLLCTYPLVLLGLACTVADVRRGVDLLGLLAQWRIFSRQEILAALGPYLPAMVVAAIALAALAAFLWPGMPRPALHGRALAVRGAAFVLLAAVFSSVPAEDRAGSWPARAFVVTAASFTNAAPLGAPATLAMAVSPRDPLSSWHAVHAGARTAPQTVVFIIGESVRSDFLRECSGPERVQPVRGGALVACDVTAGANFTGASVPLLVSRELPGHGLRVSGDGTFQRAFAEAGFSTYWFATQEEAVAWPDAQQRVFQDGEDWQVLLPLLDHALGDDHRLRSIVLHGNGAHLPYCSRFDPATAPYPNACDHLGALPSPGTLADWRMTYANAVDHSVGLVNAAIERLERLPGEAFLVYTPDHGEILFDDGRTPQGHALRHPTSWEIRVPVVFWANAAWKTAHPAQWRMLRANVSRPLMHADVVPTLLAAAGIRYADPRSLPASLLARPVPPRQRSVQQSLGNAIDWDGVLARSR